jgi:hypothetical protein
VVARVLATTHLMIASPSQVIGLRKDRNFSMRNVFIVSVVALLIVGCAAGANRTYYTSSNSSAAVVQGIASLEDDKFKPTLVGRSPALKAARIMFALAGGISPIGTA